MKLLIFFKLIIIYFVYFNFFCVYLYVRFRDRIVIRIKVIIIIVEVLIVWIVYGSGSRRVIFRLNNRNVIVIKKNFIENGRCVEFVGLNLYLYGFVFFEYRFIWGS